MATAMLRLFNNHSQRAGATEAVGMANSFLRKESPRGGLVRRNLSTGQRAMAT